MLLVQEVVASREYGELMEGWPEGELVERTSLPKSKVSDSLMGVICWRCGGIMELALVCADGERVYHCTRILTSQTYADPMMGEVKGVGSMRQCAVVVRSNDLTRPVSPHARFSYFTEGKAELCGFSDTQHHAAWKAWVDWSSDHD